MLQVNLSSIEMLYLAIAGMNGPSPQPPGVSGPRPAHQQPPSAHQQQPEHALQLTHPQAQSVTPNPSEIINKDKFIQQQVRFAQFVFTSVYCVIFSLQFCK